MSHLEQHPRPRLVVTTPAYEEAKRHTEQAVLETEKFWAAVESTSPGRKFNYFGGAGGDEQQANLNAFNENQRMNTVRQEIGMGISDDDFFPFDMSY